LTIPSVESISSSFESFNLSSTPSLSTTISTISIAEIIQDVTKWVTYDLILPSDLDNQVPIIEALLFGALSGLAGNAVFELFKLANSKKHDILSNMFSIGIDDLDAREPVKSILEDIRNGRDRFESSSRKKWIKFGSYGTVLVRFLRAGLEGGALFASYEATINFFENNALPPDIKALFMKKFTDIPEQLNEIFSDT